ncbi:helicase-exonuclease AddAB subunit AddA [Alkalibacillus aidingensis]|uniref:helicase-exonuclease AddAB subunit AddA n=1 Tax=Alkalibacillus aidingensis TaxID=2747607 RepID=UPI00166106DC|nr:helicase-exonuclease AddAB subunit AddA [Alkalibacillus aidingensis]
MKWTKEQELAIYEGGKDILVSAAAGSGKTAVLVERIIQKMLDEEDPYNIDEMLVATFTNAAAQEMRTRVGQALEKALESNPKSVHLKKQIALLQRANISTLHAFCMNVVRKYSYQLDIDPSFRILDNVESELLKRDVIQEVFEYWYGKEGEEQEAFFRFVDSFSNDRNDEQVEELVLKVHNFAIQNPWPVQWLDELVEMYDVGDDSTLDDLVWMPYARADIKEAFESLMFDVNHAINLAQEVDGPQHYLETLEQDKELFQQVMEYIGAPWEDLRHALLERQSFARLSSKKVECNEDLKQRVKDIRDRYKKKYSGVIKQWFQREPSALVNDLRKLKPQIEQLVKVVKEFDERLEVEKLERGVVDFSDLEHYSLQILLSEDATPDNLKPSEVAKQFQKQFREVLIDEYQDTNLVQETILTMLTGDESGGNLFMVGDVKQSIYGFRHAEPSLFMKKYQEFQNGENSNMRIDLARNFRSRFEVLSSTNYVFRQLLDEQVGDMEYEKEAELIYSNKVYDTLTTSDVDTELHIITRDKDDESEEQSDEWKYLEKAQLEARAYAKKIQSWVGTDGSRPMSIIDKETERPRPVKYKDIVILMRSKPWFGVVVEELKQLGIPVYADMSEGYLEAIEVQVMLNLLKSIDNPKQDIPLASVLKSPIVGLNEDELAKIRLHGRKETFHQAVKNYMRAGEDGELIRRLERFFSMFTKWRQEARYGALSQLIWQIYRETGYYEFVGGTPGGKQRQANLRALYDRARSYENTAYRGLFRFLRFIEKMEENGEDLAAARALGEQEDVVRLMSIHSSKGLEFPIVILGAADKDFNTADYKKRYLMHKRLGLGAKFMDVDNRIMYKTFPFEAISVANKREMLAEEMRVLYVALTRAKEKLVIVGTINDWDKRHAKWQEIASHPQWVLPPHVRVEQSNYLNWIGMSLIRHGGTDKLGEGPVDRQVPSEIRDDDSTWQVWIEHASVYEEPEWITVKRNDDLEQAIKEWDSSKIEAKSDEFDKVGQRLTFSYSFPSSVHHRAKQTVTELKRLRQEEDETSATDFIRRSIKHSLKRPRFMQQDDQTLTKAEIGSAMHAVMQHLPFNREWEEDGLREFVSDLVIKEILTDEEADAVDYQSILQLFKTPVGQMLLNADEVKRELPFTMELSAKEIYPDWQDDTDESVLIQGVIDCIIKYEGKWYLVDYKTDRVVGDLDDQQIKRLSDRYKLQVDLYCRAFESIWNVDLEGVFLYYFDRSLMINL